METLEPASLLTSCDLWVIQEGKDSNNTTWTKEENKRFESALAIYDEKTPDRWLKIADLTGKSVLDVILQYSKLEDDVCEIEAGHVPIPGYFCASSSSSSSSSSFALEWIDEDDDKRFNGFRKKVGGGRPCEHERRKGVPWTEEEHRLFLLGLQKYGKGDWRNISRYFVITKTPTQVASHAQKYFLRQNSIGKDKRRPSIHDITTTNLTDNFSTNEIKPDVVLDQSAAFSMNQKSVFIPKMVLEWSHPDEETFMVFNSTTQNELLKISHSDILGALKLQGQTHNNIAYHKADIGSN